MFHPGPQTWSHPWNAGLCPVVVILRVFLSLRELQSVLSLLRMVHRNSWSFYLDSDLMGELKALEMTQAQ